MIIFDSKWLLLSWKLSVEYIITKYICFSGFAVKMVKQKNFPNAVDLCFDERRIAKYYHFSKKGPFGKIFKFGWQVSDVFEHVLLR